MLSRSASSLSSSARTSHATVSAGTSDRCRTLLLDLMTILVLPSRRIFSEVRM
jgi:hypothetical protein